MEQDPNDRNEKEQPEAQLPVPQQQQQSLVINQQKSQQAKGQKQIVSEHYNYYNQHLSKFRQSGYNFFSSNRDALHSVKINSEEQFEHKLKLKIKHQSINKQIVVLEAKWGYFTTNISILNIKGQNIKHGMFLSGGAFGQIYKGQFNDRCFVIKCLDVKSEKSRAKAIKQYFLTKVCSFLRIGPRVQPYFGFDMLMFSECIQFGMEQCDPIGQSNFKSDQLYQNMTLIHNFKLIHQDIKPENIMFSPYYQRMVFIDFGLSNIITQKTGLKTLTAFVGSVNYCSPEMKKSYIDKTKKEVDLYYNDLHCLKESLEYMKNLLKTQIELQENILQISRPIHFEYLNEIILKWYLYQNNINKFNEWWQKSEIKSNIEYYRGQIMLFLDELCPNKQLRYILPFILTDKYSDTQIYSKIKILYQVFENNLSELQIFQEKDKYKYFQLICQQFFLQCSNEDNHKHEQLQIRQFMLDLQKAKKLKIQDYLSYYIEFINFLNNKHYVTSEQRFQAAQVYLNMWIPSQTSQNKNRRQLIQLTITDCFQKLLKLSQQINNDDIILLLFNAFDIMFILDIGSSKQFINYVYTIFNHKAMNLAYRMLFIARIEQLNEFNSFRIVPKIDISRYQFEQMIQKWIVQNKRVLQHDQNKEEQYKLIDQLPEKIMIEYGWQTFQYQQIINVRNRSVFNQYKQLIELYHQLRYVNIPKKVFLFLPQLYRSSYFKGDNNNLSNQIYEILRVNFADDDLLQQFSFKFWAKLAFKHLHIKKKSQTTIEEFQQINSYLSKIKIEELFLFENVIIQLCNEIKSQQIRNGWNIDFAYAQNGFINRLFDTIKLKLKLKACKNTENHQCISAKDVLKLYFIGMIFPNVRNTQIDHFIKKQISESTQKCQTCCQLMESCQLANQLHFSFIKHHDSQNQIEKNKYIQSFFCLYNKFINIYEKKQQIQRDEYKILVRCLTLGQLFCSDYELYQLECKYHGIYNYYLFVAQKLNKIQLYFSNYQHFGGIVKIMQLLSKTRYQQFIELIFRFAQYIQDNPFIKNYVPAQRGFYHLIKQYSNEEKINLFNSLRQAQSNSKFNSSYIALFYVSILTMCKDNKLAKKIIKAISENIEKIHYVLKRQIVIRIFFHFYKKQQIVKKKRQWKFCNNRLLKWLIVDNRTNTSKHKRKLNKTRQINSLYKKLNKIEQYEQQSPPLRVCMRRK